MKKDKETLLKCLNNLNKNSNLSELQDYIEKMMNINEFNNTPLELFCYLTEEVGELAKEIRKSEANMDMDNHKKYDSSLSDELADVFIYILALVNSYNIDLFDALKNKEIKNIEREWE